MFLDLASSFEPPESLSKFLDEGEPPVYIGFGSIVVDDPDQFTELIFEAVKQAGVRALVSKGWGGLGGTYFCSSIVTRKWNGNADFEICDRGEHSWQCLHA